MGWSRPGRPGREGPPPTAPHVPPSAGAPFGSNLSVASFRQAVADGWRPRGLVAGSAVFRVSWASAFTGPGRSLVPAAGEMAALSRLAAQGWQLALERLRAELVALQAHGALGLRLRRSGWDFAGGLVEFTALGTAVDREGAPPPARPFAAAMGGVDTSQLLRAGYVPLWPVVGACVAYVPDTEARWAERAAVSRNQPLPATSAAIAACRRQAVARMQAEAAATGAQGVVGVRSPLQVEAVSFAEDLGGLVVACTAMGTAVAGAGGDARQAPLPALDLAR
jgi:uncharacterized protein YbjQ (UPF0145 family)